MTNSNIKKPYVYQPYGVYDTRAHGGRMYGVCGFANQPTILGLLKEDADALAAYYQWILDTPDLWEADLIRRENEKLRKIAAHVPAAVYIKAKESAGFGEGVTND